MNRKEFRTIKPSVKRKKKKKNNNIRFIFIILIIAVILTALSFIKDKNNDSGIYVNSVMTGSKRDITLEPARDLPVYAEVKDLSSRCVLFVNLDSQKVICEKNSFEKVPVASLTKIMTAVVALENIDDLNTEFTMTKGIISYLESENAAVAGFKAGETVTAKDLLYATLLPSGGDGALGLAMLAGGNKENFVEMMNAKVRQLGLERTHFSNPIGFDDDENYSCAYDISVIFEYALSNDYFREVITTQSYTSSPGAYHPEGIKMTSTVYSGYKSNNLEMGYVEGGKTGYTTDAGLCLATFARVEGERYILITLGAGEGKNTPKYNFFDTVKIYSKYLSKK